MKKVNKKVVLGVLAGLVIAIVIFTLSSRKPKEEYSTVKAVFGPLVQTVSETGMVKPVQEVSLNFLNSGRLSEVYVKIGDEVSAGSPLAALEKESLELRKLEVEASLKIAEANLSKVLAGASNEVVAVSLSELEQAQSAENAARIDLEKVKRTVAENIAQTEKTLRDLESSATSTDTPQEQAVSAAQTALDNAKATGQKTVDNSRNSALLVLNDRVLAGKIALDNLKTLLELDDTNSFLGVKDSALLPRTKNSRLLALDLLPQAEAAVATAQKSEATYDITQAGAKVKDFLLQTSQSLSNAYSLLEATITWAGFSQVQLDSYKTLMSSQSAQVSAASTAVENSLQAFNGARVAYDTSVASAEENLRQAKVNLESAISTARNNLNNLRLNGDQQIAAAQARLNSAARTVALSQARLKSIAAPARVQDIALAEAQVSQARASLANIEKQITDSILTAPLSGVITQVNYNPGEQFGATGQPMVRMLADNNFEIEVDISESDINKVKIGDAAAITLDAFSDDINFPGQVSFIEPAQTLIQGVVYYRVTISLTDLDKIQTDLAAKNLALKSGMTANIVITTAKRDRVLRVPARALIESEGRRIIRVLSGGQALEIPVTIGLRGDEGLVEIIDGLSENDEVITFIRNAK